MHRLAERLEAAARRLALLALLAAAIGASAAATAARAAGAGVTTAAYGGLRDDWDEHEPALGPAAVRSAGFGQLFTAHLQGAIYAQPLVYEGDVLVSTEQAHAYALNATTGKVVWQRTFGTAMKSSATGCTDLTPYVGSTATGVIDPSTGTLYLTTRLVERKQKLADSHWYLQAVSTATGEERAGFPVEIAGTPQNTEGVPFDEARAEQRPGLLLMNGVVYMAFASDCDITPYRGVVVGVNASSGRITTMWSDEAGVGAGEDSQAGIWQSGAGLVSYMPGQLILTTGNGVSPSPAPSGSPPATLSESVVALDVGSEGQLTPAQFFAPSDAPTLDEDDEDLGSGGPMALPQPYFGTGSIPHLLVQVGKDGRIFLLDAEAMGGYRQGPGGGDDVLQTVGPFGGVWGHPAAYGGQGGWVYVLQSAGGGYLQALSYGLDGEGVPELTPEATSSESFGYASGSPLVTSDGTEAGSAVVWVVYAKGNHQGDGQLRAYTAVPAEGSMQLLWSAKIGKPVKFTTPTAYEGVVYVGNREGELLAFGPSAPAPVQAAPVQLGSTPVGSSSETTLTVSATRTVTVTGPVSASGEQGETSPQTGAAAAGRTAGPSTIPSAGTAALADGVIAVQQPRPGTALAAGGSLRLRVRFSPRHAGPVVGEISIRTSAGTRAVSFSGYGTERGLALSSQPLAFGTVATGGGGRMLALTFSNSWSRPERITGFRLPAPPYRVSGLPRVGTVLAPRRSVTVAVLFAPRRSGSYPADLQIRTDHGSVTLPASGEGVAGRPRLVVSESVVRFGTVPLGQSRTRTFYVRDGGRVPLTITRAIAPEAPFGAPVALPEGLSVEPGLLVAVKVSFTPTAPGPASGTYVLHGDDGRGYLRVRLTGTGG